MSSDEKYSATSHSPVLGSTVEGVGVAWRVIALKGRGKEREEDDGSAPWSPPSEGVVVVVVLGRGLVDVVAAAAVVDFRKRRVLDGVGFDGGESLSGDVSGWYSSSSSSWKIDQLRFGRRPLCFTAGLEGSGDGMGLVVFVWLRACGRFVEGGGASGLAAVVEGPVCGA